MKILAFMTGFACAVSVNLSAARADEHPSDPYDGKIHIDVTPYVWAPTLNGQFRFPLSKLPPAAMGVPIAKDLSQTFDAKVGPNSYLANINFALMANATIRIGNVALYSDLINANVSGARSTVTNLTGPRGNLNATISNQAQSQIVSTLWTVGPSYSVYHTEKSSVDILAGGRFLWLSANANVQLTGALGGTHTAGVSRKVNYGDFVIGTYGHIGLGGHWSAPYYLDAGFGTPSSWQGIVGVKYGNTSLSWRYLQYNASSSDALLQRLSLGGPMIGYTLKL